MTSSCSTTPRVALLMQGTRSYERGLLRGIADYSNLHGPWQFYRHVPYLPGGEAPPVELVRTWRPDALIVRESAPHHFDDLFEMSVPTVYAPSTECRPGLSNIVVDDHAVGMLAAQHLYESGLRSFAFCGMNELFFWSRLRCEGFCDAVHRFGHEVTVFESPLGGEFLSWNKSFAVLRQWLADLPAPTGVLVCTDDFSLLVQEACQAAGRSIPEEIALIGVGNDEAVCELATTPLSSIALNTERAGYDAARHLSERLVTPSCAAQDIVVAPLHVVARRSTDVAATRDPQVSRAISFIRGAVNRSISVGDVVREVHISRRALYDRFQAETGQTISAYIRRRRLDHFTRMLLETNLTISEIAYAMGYGSDANIARLFQKFHGTTPLAYRRKYAGQHGRGK